MKTVNKILSIVLCLSIAIGICTCITFAEDEYIVGDLDLNGVVDNNDAIHLLYSTVFGEQDYPLNQPCDFTGDGVVDNQDAIYLLYHTIFGEDEYPLVPKEPDEPEQPVTYTVPLTTANWDYDSGMDESIVKYNADGSVFIESGSIVGWSIPKQVEIGKTVTVTVKGSSVGGFRMWLLSPGQATSSNIVYASDLGFVSGDFEYTFTLTCEDRDNKGITYADAICFKASAWNTQLEQLLIESVEVTYPPEVVDNRNWIAAWGSAQLTAGNDHLPKNISLSNNTVRQQIRTTKAGRTARFVFSNESGNGPLTINAATVAHLVSPSSSKIDTSTLQNITFGGSTSVTIPAGQTITSDEIKYSFEALDDLAVTLYLGSVPSNVTSHTASRCTTWIAKGNGTASETISGETTTSWYFLSRVDVVASANAGTIVCLGDSLTDGASVTTNGFSRWPDELARQLNATGFSDYSVVNMGIGATPLMGAWGSSGEARFNRDVLNVPGVKALIILYGVNDIGYASSDISQNIINMYKNMIDRCHANGIEVYGCTITPFYKPTGSQDYYSELHEQIRLKVNEFIMSPDSGFDGYIDTASAVANPSDSKQMQKQYVSVWGDWLHFNDTGYKFVGKTVYDAIKSKLD
ncbi:MAG: hypothetical protein IJ424_00620 [Oscillospiraceae bacterium]|nr:hypothetical protein [Oscillospiraceae bacterium]